MTSHYDSDSRDPESLKPVTQLLIESQSSLYAFIYSLLGRGEDASDVLQEANLALLAKADEYDRSRSFMSWACRFAQLQVLAYRKRQGRDRLWFDDELVNTLAAELDENLSESDVRLGVLAQCIKKLRPEHRGLLLEYYEHGLSYAEIAEPLGKKVGTISVAMLRIRRKLFDCIQHTITFEGLR